MKWYEKRLCSLFCFLLLNFNQELFMKQPSPQYDHTHLLWFVTGAVHKYFSDTNQPTSGVNFESYLHDTIHKVVGFLRGTQNADASFSDMQCNVALAAETLFQPDRKPSDFYIGG